MDATVETKNLSSGSIVLERTRRTYSSRLPFSIQRQRCADRGSDQSGAGA